MRFLTTGRGLLAALTLMAASAATALPPPDPEQQLLAALEAWQRGHSADALRGLDELLRRQPNFRLAHLLRGDLLAARAGRKDLRLASADPELAGLVDEARLRLRGWRQAPFEDAIPEAVLQLGGHVRHALVADLDQARLYLLEQQAGRFRVVRSFYASIGKMGVGKQVMGDNRTPVGVYDITGWIDGERLPDLYGAGAFPLDYPNAWDRRQHRTGSGIWVHGVPRDTFARVPRSSEGCVTLANADLMALRQILVPGRSPVILTHRVRWVAPEEAQAVREDLLAHIDDWRRAWSSRDTERYLDFYASDFSTEGMDRAAFADYKRRVNASKKFIEVQIRDLQLFRYPGDEPLVLARFTQDYRSHNFERRSRKEQFWRRDGRRWRIVLEETR